MRDRCRRPLFLFVLTTLLAGLAAGLAVGAELVVRRAKLGTTRLPELAWSADPLLAYRLNPRNPDTPDGFRGRSPREVAGRHPLVLCLGESTTFGYGLTASEAWPHALEEHLHAVGCSAVTLNAGVNGYGSHQHLLRYERDLAGLGADWVVVYAGWNRSGMPGEWDVFRPMFVRLPGDPWTRGLAAWLGAHSYLGRRGLEKAVAWNAGRHGEEWYPDPTIETWAEQMQALVAAIQGHDQRAALVLYPALFEHGMEEADLARYARLMWSGRRYRPAMLADLDRHQQVLRRIAAESGATLIDVRGAFAGIRGDARAALFLDHLHPSAPDCQRIAAEDAAALRHAGPRARSRGGESTWSRAP